MAKKGDKAIQVSRKGLLLWGSLALFIAAWMFVLGILVGRGYAPVDVSAGKLEQELAALKAAMAKKEQAQVDAQSGTDGANPPELGFFKALKENQSRQQMKMPPPKKSKPAAPQKPAKTAKPAKPAPTPKPAPPKPRTAKPPVKATKPAPSKGHFTIQVAAVKVLANAEKLVKDLRGKGYPAYQVRVSVPGKGDWYRVRVGAYDKRPAADQMLKTLKAKKINGMVISTD